MTKLRWLYMVWFGVFGGMVGLMMGGIPNGWIGAGMGIIIGTFFRGKRPTITRRERDNEDRTDQ